MSLKFYLVPDYEFAEVSECGKIRNAVSKRLLKPHYDKDGYLRHKIWVGDNSKSLLVHRAVAKAFIPNPDNKPQVNHINSIRDDNRISNLEWVTPKENSEHGVRFGNIVGGEDNARSILTNATVIDICNRLNNEQSIVSIARELGVGKDTIQNIKSGSSWLSVSKDILKVTCNTICSDEDAEKIIKYLNDGFSNKEIISLMNKKHINRHTVGNIKLNKTFKHIKRLC